MSFGKVATLNGNATTKDPGSLDLDETLATDGAGNWIAVWDSNDSLGGTIGNDSDILMSRSSDNGTTWAFPVPLNPDAATNPVSKLRTDVATDRAGVWLAGWVVSATSPEIVRSTDNGATWTAPVTLPIASGGPLRIVSLSGGQWIVVMKTSEALGGLGTDSDLVLMRTLDDGGTWSAPVPLNTDAATDSFDEGAFDLASDGAGTLVAVWSRINDSVLASSTSTDGGMTWSAPVTVSTLTNFPVGLFPSVATDGAGKWIVVWSSNDDLGGTIGTDTDILFTVSTDAGATWSAAAPVDPNAGSDPFDDFGEDIATDGNGNWYASWDGGVGGNKGFADQIFSRSTDGGVTWSAPAAVNVDAGRDWRDDLGSQLFFDGTSRWLAVWGTAPFVGGSFTGELNIAFAISDDDCPVLPVTGCKMPGKALLAMKDKAGGAIKDKLKWKWSKGDATSASDIGNPETSSNYVLCLYDGTGGGQRVELEKDAAAASTCKDKPCWSPTNKGEKYKDGRGEQGAIKAIKINTGAAGTTSVKVTAKGVALGLPRLPLSAAPGVTVQLINLENGVCWQADFNDPPIQNTADGFKAKF